MADIQFPSLGPGTMNAVVKDNNGNPATVLEASKAFTIETDWHLDAASASVLAGEFEVTAYVESIGPGPERRVGAATQLVNGGLDYATVITVPANTLPDNPAPPASGVYKLITVLTHRNFGKITDVAAFVEGPIVRIG